MKKYTKVLLVLVLMNLQGALFATDWNKPDKGYYHTQKDIEADVAALQTRTMATIQFGDQLFSFVNYENPLGNDHHKIILRKLTNTGGFNPNWTVEKQDNITHLNKGLSDNDWQPAPVIFNNVLYLFVGNLQGGISYSVYNAGSDTWSELIAINNSHVGVGMVAVVVDSALCIAYDNGNGNVSILRTVDLNSWTNFDTGFKSKYYDGSNTSCQYSAISQTFWNEGKKKAKLLIAYLDNNLYARFCEYYWDDSGQPQLISSKTISSENSYTSVALVEGTVNGDNTSTGKCVQAFLKLSKKDNGYCRYRIQRFQLKDGAWTKAENNLVKQNYLWASDLVTLTAVNYSIPASDGSEDLRQFMCLIYRGYDDWDHPLNGAWVETDRLVQTENKTIILSGPENTQYIGYIEGPPPFNVNNKTGQTPYERSYKRISELEFSHSNTQTSETDLSYDFEIDLNVKASWFKGSANVSYANATGYESKITTTSSVTIEADSVTRGYYIKFTPQIISAKYYVYDWRYHPNSSNNSNPIDTTYYCYMSEPMLDYEPVDLSQYGLIPGDLSTYMNRQFLDNYIPYTIANKSNAWTAGLPEASKQIKIETGKSSTNTYSGKINISAELGEHFELGFGGSIDYSIKTTTGQGNEITCYSRLNEPVDPTDVEHLQYNIFWINPNPNSQTNWWLHAGALNQNTWCLTYNVTQYQTLDGTIYESIGNPSNDEEPLATNVIDFTAINAPEGVKLNWQTLKEENNYGFEIERTSTASSLQNLSETGEWESLGFVEGAENSNTPKEYSFIDAAPLIGKTSYRLKQLNTERKFKYSGVVEIEVEQFLATGFNLAQNYPNPFNPTTNISFTVPKNGYASLKIFNTLGQEVASLFNGEAKAGIKNQVQFNGTGMASGTYFSRLEYGGKVLLKKIQLMK